MHTQKGPLDVVVANLNATSLLKHHGVLYELRRLCNGNVLLVLSTSIEGMFDELNGILLRRGIRHIYGYGGDRTQASIIDWIQSLPPEREQPTFTPLPAGQMNMLARACGFRKRPLKWLAGILDGTVRLESRSYRPLLVADPVSGAKRHSIIMADGVVYEFIRVYDKAGKGNAFVVFGWFLAIVVWWFARKLARGAYTPLVRLMRFLPRLKKRDRHPLFRRHDGQIEVGDQFGLTRKHYGFVLSTLPHVAAGMRPFRGGPIADGQFWSIAYWGPIMAVVKCLWQLVSGRGNLKPMRPWMFNRPIAEATIELPGGWIFDGDPEPCALRVPDSGEMIRRVSVTLAPAINLLVHSDS